MNSHVTDFRALTPFKVLASGLKTFPVNDDASAPHLQRGEFAVIDTADRDPQHGELYVIQYEGGRREIVQVQSKRKSWWIGDLRGFRKSGDARGGVPIYVGLEDGPYTTKSLKTKLIGRIVGVASSALGDLLAEQAVQS